MKSQHSFIILLILGSGVDVMRLDAQASPQTLRLLAPTSVYNGDNGIIALDRRAKIAAAPNGDVFVLESQGSGVFALSRTGGAPKRVGRKGSGPGEFLRPLSLGWRGDTLWISDTGTQRVTMLPEWGAGTPSSFVVVGSRDRTFMTGLPLAITPDSHAVVGVLAIDQRLNQFGAIQRLPLLRTTRDGSHTSDTLLLLDGRNATLTIDLPNKEGRIVQRQPMGDGSLSAVSHDGTKVVHVERTDGAVVTLRTTAARTIYTRRLTEPTVPLTRVDASTISQSALDDLNASLRKSGAPPITRADYERNLYVPKSRVPVTDVVLGDDGTVLLRGNDWIGDVVRYTWLTANGTTLGSFEVSVRQFIRAVAGKQIWSTLEDADGDIRIVRQRLP